MARPIEYENLLRTGAFKDAASSDVSIAQFLRAADEMAAAIRGPMPPGVRFVLAYEGMFNVVMAVLEFHGVRPGDGAGHRATAIGRVAADLRLGVSEQSTLARLHDARDRVTYRQPVPPVTKADADAMATLLALMLPAAKKRIRAG